MRKMVCLVPMVKPSAKAESSISFFCTCLYALKRKYNEMTVKEVLIRSFWVEVVCSTTCGRVIHTREVSKDLSLDQPSVLEIPKIARAENGRAIHCTSGAKRSLPAKSTPQRIFNCALGGYTNCKTSGVCQGSRLPC